MAAAGILLDRGWGKAAQPVTSDEDGGPIVVEIVQRARGANERVPGSGTWRHTDATEAIAAKRFLELSVASRFIVEEYISICVILLDHRVIDQISTRRLRIVKYRGTTTAPTNTRS